MASATLPITGLELKAPAKCANRRTPPVLSAIVVNYCQWHRTAHLVQSLTERPQALSDDVEVVVVDNHSPAHRLARRLRRWPGVSLRRWQHNRGFARAVNEGFRLSQGSWLLLLNPDVTVPAGFCARVLDCITERAARDPQVGIIGFQIRNDDSSLQGSCGHFPTLVSTLTRLFLPRNRRKYQAPGGGGQAVDWVTGCCLLVRRECLQQLEGMDDSFFLYYEDVDLCRRARASGWAVWYEPRVAVIHHRPLHSRPVIPILRFLTRHGLLLYATRHWPPWQRLVLAGIVGIESLLRRCWTAWNQDRKSADLFRELGHLNAEIARGRVQEAARRVRQVLRQHGASLATAVDDFHPARCYDAVQKETTGAAFDRDSQPQSA